MSFPAQAVSTNATAIVLLISLLLNFRTKYIRGKNDTRIFFYMMVLNIVQCIIEPVTIVIDGELFPFAARLSMLLNTCLYINNILFAYLWSLYADFHMRGTGKRRFAEYIKFLPAALIVVLAIVNIFTPVFFTVSAENVYKRAPLFIITYIVTYAYLIRGTIAAYSSRRRPRRYVFLPALTFLGPVFLASIVQFIFPGVSMLWAGSAIGLASAYISLLDEGASIDTLSGAYSRYYLANYLRAMPRSVIGSGTAAGIMIDIDRFKSINDTFGHQVGDEAIRHTGKILLKASKSGDMVFRYGGDEFIILTVIEKESELAALTDRINEELRAFNKPGARPYTLSFSIGYALRSPDEDESSFLRRIDDAMYQNKRRIREDA